MLTPFHEKCGRLLSIDSTRIHREPDFGQPQNIEWLIERTVDNVPIYYWAKPIMKKLSGDDVSNLDEGCIYPLEGTWNGTWNGQNMAGFMVNHRPKETELQTYWLDARELVEACDFGYASQSGPGSHFLWNV